MLATLLLQPNLPGLVLLDEPELGLHPYAIVQLADMLRAAAASCQVAFTTQSVTLMDQFALDDLIVVERQGGSEETVVGDLFEPHFRDRGWDVTYSILRTKRVAGQVAYQGGARMSDRPAGSDARARVAQVEEATRRAIGHPSFLPNL